MIGRFAATTLALALCATAAEAAPQALRGSMAAPADGASAGETVVAPTRRAPRRSARRAQPSERVLAVPADAVLAAPAAGQASSAPVLVVPPRRPVVRVAARPATAAVPGEAVAAPAQQVVVAPEAPVPGVRSRRRAARVAARAPTVTAPVEAVAAPTGEVVEAPDVEPVGRSRRRGARAWTDRATPAVTSRRSDLDARIAAHAQATGVPADLIHHVITRESRYNPGAIGPGGVYGLMQLKHGTARGLGYSGTPSGLLDPETNLTYGVRYLAGAYKVAGGNPTRAYSLFRSGYYYHAKRQGIRSMAYAAAPEPAQTASVGAAPTLGDALSRIFAPPANAAQADPAR
jgi:soluble lytic murein transglycosylase-like protein